MQNDGLSNGSGGINGSILFYVGFIRLHFTRNVLKYAGLVSIAKQRASEGQVQFLDAIKRAHLKIGCKSSAIF